MSRPEECHSSNAALAFHRSQQAAAISSAPPATDRNNATPSVTTSRNARDVIDTNRFTKNVEFYGSASSVAFLRHVETLSECHPASALPSASGHSLASLLHNTEFEPNTCQGGPGINGGTKLSSDRFYFRMAPRFLDACFRNIHYIQPIFEEDVFLARCEDLWFNKATKQPLSFVALYYATLSLGSLVMTLEDSTISGQDRFIWSRKLCNDALPILKGLWSATDLEMVQCFYMMASSNDKCPICKTRPDSLTIVTTYRAKSASMSSTRTVRTPPAFVLASEWLNSDQKSHICTPARQLELHWRSASIELPSIVKIVILRILCSPQRHGGEFK